MWNDKWPQQCCLFCISLCVRVCIMCSCSDHVTNLYSGQHFTPGCWTCKCSYFLFLFFSLEPVHKNSQLVIRFCAAAGYVCSFFLRATVGAWNGQAAKESGVHVRSTQRVPKLDHVSAPTRSLQMEHKSPLTTWKMTGNQICTMYGINAMEMRPLTETRSLSV